MSEVEKYDITRMTAMQRDFADQYIIDLNADAAAERSGCSQSNAHKLLKLPHVKAYIHELQAARIARTGITADMVVKEIWEALHTDVNELVQYRRNCCRYCWSENHEYQFTEPQFKRALEEAERQGVPPQFWPKEGRNGYDKTREPNKDCPDCMGEGQGEVHAMDTRHMSKAAKFLYSGAKVGRDGLEIKVMDKIALLTMMAKHTGALREREDEAAPRNTAPVLNLMLAPGVTATVSEDKIVIENDVKEK